MLTFSGEQLQTVAGRILEATGMTRENAAVVAAELRDANLVGHDSHGVIRLAQYADYIRNGFLDPHGKLEVVTDGPAYAVIDGNRQAGQVCATLGLKLGVEKARVSGTATVLIRNCLHVGRLGSYLERGARAGFACMMCVNAPGPGGVAPFGGIERRLGTNPIAMAAPAEPYPLVLDMTTSATAEGKLRVAFQKGETVPEGWIIDGQGNPSTNPADYYNPPVGALLPLGGALGFKGFGLSVMVDLFGGILSRSGVCRTDLPPGANGVWMYFVEIEKFIPRAEYDALLKGYVAHIKSSKLAAGVSEILMPGEIEQRRKAQRTADGIPVAEGTWRQILDVARQHGVSLDDLSPLSAA